MESMDDNLPFNYGLHLLANAIELLDSPKQSNGDVHCNNAEDRNAWWINIPRKKRTPTKQKTSSSPLVPSDDDQPHVDSAARKQQCRMKRKLEPAVSILLEGNNFIAKKPRKNNNIVKRQSNRMDLRLCPKSPPEDVMALIESIGGSDVKLVTRKTIQETDLKTKHNRLSIPQSLLVMPDFLSEQEKEIIQREIVKVILIDPCLDFIENLSFRKWIMGNSFIYALCHNWNLVVRKNNLMQGEVIHLWSFRVAGELWFALVREKDHPVMDA